MNFMYCKLTSSTAFASVDFSNRFIQPFLFFGLFNDAFNIKAMQRCMVG
jgi:hypothetical protein